VQIQNDQRRCFLDDAINFARKLQTQWQDRSCTIDGVHYDQCTVATQEVLDSAGNVVLTNPAGAARRARCAGYLGPALSALPAGSGVRVSLRATRRTAIRRARVWALRVLDAVQIA
jgi:hypothetical protein